MENKWLSSVHIINLFLAMKFGCAAAKAIIESLPVAGSVIEPMHQHVNAINRTPSPFAVLRDSYFIIRLPDFLLKRFSHKRI